MSSARHSIFVARDGENSIAVAGGANARLSPADVNKAAGLIRGAALLVAQLETPLATVIAAALVAVKAGVPVILSRTPAQAALAQDLGPAAFGYDWTTGPAIK